MVESNQQQQQLHNQSTTQSSNPSSSPQSARWLASLLSHAGLSTSPHNKDAHNSNNQDSWDAHWLPNYASRWNRDRDPSPPIGLDGQETEEDDDDEINLEAELDLLQDSDDEFQFEDDEEEIQDGMEHPMKVEEEVRERQRVQSQEEAREKSTSFHSSQRATLSSSSTPRSVTFDLPPTNNRQRSSTTVQGNALSFRTPSSSSIYGTPRRKPRSSSSLLTHRRSISEGDKETLQLLRNHYGRVRNSSSSSEASVLKPVRPLSINTFLPIRMVPSSTVPSHHQEDKENVNSIKEDPTSASNSPIRPKVLDPVPSPIFTSSPSTTLPQNLPLSLKLTSVSGGDSHLSMTRSSSLSDGSCHGDVGDEDPEGQLERGLSDIGSTATSPSDPSPPSHQSISDKDNSSNVEGGLKISTFGLPLSNGNDSPTSGPSTPIPRPSSTTIASKPASSTYNRLTRPHVHRSNSHQRSRLRLSQTHHQQSPEPIITENQIRAHAGPFINSVVDSLFSSAESRASKVGGRRRAGTDGLHRGENGEATLSSSRMEDELQARQRAYTATLGSIPSTAYAAQPRSRSRGRTPGPSAQTITRESINRGPHNLNGFSHRFVARMSNSSLSSSRSSSLERRTIKGQRSSSPSPSQDSFSGQSISSMDTIKTSESSSSTCPSLSSSMSSSPSSTSGNGGRHSKSSSISSSGYMSGFNLSQTLARAYHSLPIPSLFSNETDSQLAKLERDCPLEDSPSDLDSHGEINSKKDKFQQGLNDLRLNQSSYDTDLMTRDYSVELERDDLEKINRGQDRSSSVNTIAIERRRDLAFSPKGRFPSLNLNGVNGKARHSDLPHVSPLWRETDDDDDEDEDEWEEMTEDQRIRI